MRNTLVYIDLYVQKINQEIFLARYIKSRGKKVAFKSLRWRSTRSVKLERRLQLSAWRGLRLIVLTSCSSTHLPLSTYPVRCLLPLRLESLLSTGITELSTHGVFRSFTFVADVLYHRETLRSTLRGNPSLRYVAP